MPQKTQGQLWNSFVFEKMKMQVPGTVAFRFRLQHFVYYFYIIFYENEDRNKYEDWLNKTYKSLDMNFISIKKT